LGVQFDYQAMAWGPDIFGLCLIALAVDALLGNAGWLRRLIPHPALILAAATGGLAARLNRVQRGPATRLIRGLLVVIILLVPVFLIGLGFQKLSATIPFFWIAALILIVAMVVQRGPFDEIAKVTKGFAADGLGGARRSAVDVIGPAAEKMNEAQIFRELAWYLAGRFADGLVAAVFWLLILGLPGLLLWRAINIAGRLLDETRPGMAQFGLIATRLNEAVGLLPCWLAAIILALAAIFVPGAHPLQALGSLFRPGDTGLRYSERAAINAAAAALALNRPGKNMTGPDLLRMQYLYAVACLLVFAFVVVQAMLRYAI
jgi:adenosylcobinamide-phosphate synthase